MISAVEAPSVNVSGEGIAVAGNSYTVTCAVILPNGVHGVSPNIQWKRPNMPFGPGSSISATDEGFLATLQLQSLQGTDVGEYICQAGYFFENLTSPLVTDSITLEFAFGEILITINT